MITINCVGSGRRFCLMLKVRKMAIADVNEALI
jgi:hypothetical protein